MTARFSERFRALQQNASVHSDGIPAPRSVSGESVRLRSARAWGFILTSWPAASVVTTANRAA